MKYYDELNNLESEQIRLDLMCDALSVIGNGAKDSPQDHVQHSIWLMEETLRDINNKIDDAFRALFEKIRDDEMPKENVGEQNQYDFASVEGVVRNWAEKKEFVE